jgi:hypothetical protein
MEERESSDGWRVAVAGFLERVEVAAGTGAWLLQERGGGGGKRGRWRLDAAGGEVGRRLACEAAVVGFLLVLVTAVPVTGGGGQFMTASGEGRRAGGGDE